MCGIAGCVGGAGPEGAVRGMMAALARRGPDAEGLEVWPDVALGHRRLSIFDLSEAGRQPMLSTDRSIGVVFNGAIYNFMDLRAELEREGKRFRTRTDTEVLIHGYQLWGIDRLIGKLRGMFAIGLWDQPRRTLYLVRDRLGVKPMLYSARNGTFAFASTARALAAGGVAGEIDAEAMAEYLEFGYVTDDRAIYSDVRKLPAATILEWRAGAFSQREYWRPAPAGELGPSLEEAVDEVERRFLEAVRMRLEADVPVGALLSGGVDSSLVCWAIAKLGGRIRAFTIGAPGDEWDETADARQTARELGIDHEVIDVSPDDAPGVDDLVAAYGEPFACASALGMIRVARAVKPAATVLLTGDGGDDCFLGYPEHRHFWWAQRVAQWIPGPAARAWLSTSGDTPRQGQFKRFAHFLDFATGGLGAVTRIHDGLPYYRQHGLLGERLDGRQVTQRTIAKSAASARRLLADFLEYDRRTRFTGEYLTKVDGGSMYYALEARSPFLDQELWNYAQSLPYSLRLGGGLKTVLRELVRRRLSARVATGRKRGFGIPVRRWLAGKWRRAFEDLLDDSELDRQGWIHANAVRERLQTAAQAGGVPNQLWYLFVLEAWLRRERASAGEPAFAGDARTVV
jgi:asparagine synthase (glutamine-hydrolysing)